MSRRRRKAVPLPLMLAELAIASWETMARRMMMMADGTCSPLEYQRMVFEKALAAQRTSRAVVRRSRKPATLLAPWHKGATANAKRLRRKK
jgi:hypothetical protein